MKTALAILLFLASPFAWAAPKVNPAEYTVKVHVVSSHLTYANTTVAQILDVVVNGQKYELGGYPTTVSRKMGFITPGDYRARIVSNDTSGNYAQAAQYELLFPDGKTQKFTLIGESEQASKLLLPFPVARPVNF